MSNKRDEIKKIINFIFKHDQCSDEYEIACIALWHKIQISHGDMLRQLVMDGPVEDGDVISKSMRSDLIEFGLASRASIKGEQGYTVANYTGCDVLRIGSSA